MKSRNVCFLILITLLLSASAPFTGAQSKPNLSGTWKMNRDKSKFERGGPSNISIKFDQQESSLKEALTLTNDGGDRTLNLNYTLDGKESVQSLDGQEVKASAKWEGTTLIIQFRNDEGFSFTRKVTMSADGKTMTMNVRQTNQNGEVNDVVLLEKQ